MAGNLIYIDGKPYRVREATIRRIGWFDLHVAKALPEAGGGPIHAVHTVPHWWWTEAFVGALTTGGHTYSKTPPAPKTREPIKQAETGDDGPWALGNAREIIHKGVIVGRIARANWGSFDAQSGSSLDRLARQVVAALNKANGEENGR
jgi:hypothetical protein